MTKVTLHKVKRTYGKKTRHVWMMRWHVGDKRHGEQIGNCNEMSKSAADDVRDIKQSEFRTNKVRADKPEKVTISQMVEEYVSEHEFD